MSSAPPLPPETGASFYGADLETKPGSGGAGVTPYGDGALPPTQRCPPDLSGSPTGAGGEQSSKRRCFPRDRFPVIADAHHRQTPVSSQLQGKSWLTGLYPTRVVKVPHKTVRWFTLAARLQRVLGPAVRTGPTSLKVLQRLWALGATVSPAWIYQVVPAGASASSCVCGFNSSVLCGGIMDNKHPHLNSNPW